MKNKCIACFGDSITQGQPGISYLKYLDKKVYQNHGVGGDTLTGMIKRVKEYIVQSTCSHFIIEIGTNDILLPYLKNSSSLWENRTKDRNKVFIVDMAMFSDEYQKLIELLYNREISVISIPCLGENINSELNKKVDEYNQAIMKICSKKSIRYIDFNTWQKKNIREKENHYFISKNPNDIIWDTLMTSYLGQSERVSQKRNLDTTVDGVHLNSKGAKGLAELIIKENQ